MVIRIAINCAEGYNYNWAEYIAKEFLEDARDAQEKGRPFHYSWLLVLIALVGWQEPIEAQFSVALEHMPGAARYASLWVSQVKAHQQMTNYVFSFYIMDIQFQIAKTPRLSNNLFSQYDGATAFSIDMHHTFIQARTDPQHQWLKLPYVVNEGDIRAVVQHWPVEWLKDVGKKPHIPVPIATNVGVGPSH